jgi:glycerol-3-phosphate dehydrogenase
VYTQVRDGRAIFLIPWNEQLLVGTTEVPDRDDPSRVKPSEDEIGYLLSAVNEMFPQAEVSVDDVTYAYAGIRPLPHVTGAEPTAITRRPILWDHKSDDLSGMISVIGGKLTTAGSLARRCARAMGLRPEPMTPVAVAAGTASGVEIALRHWAETMSKRSGLSVEAAQRIAIWHGPRAMCIVRAAMTNELARRPLCPHTEHIVAEAVNALHFEHAVTLGDVLLRRVPVALGSCWSAECSRAAAKAIGAAMAWSEEEIEWQFETLEEERKRFLFKPGRARQLGSTDTVDRVA